MVMRLIPTLLLVAVLLAGLGSLRPAAAQLPRTERVKADLVVVHKKERILELLRDGRVIESFPIALGPNPVGPKRKEGDGRTPEGVYTLDWRTAYSQYYRAMHISYPRDDDLTHAVRWGVPPGGLIMLHGLPNGVPAARVGHPWSDWTNGCIAVTNEEMDRIWSMVDDGTTIIIYP
jgi:murein L,D-transpeptidase YafK